ncbi:hypothetical protein JRQ81_010820 [Phrynocephalus forsythii]|uniref:G-protein coupled receptors family 1 profile domain-containing protein n=1 Tax=Phrynocephalus forsythii TaxID=171643 RepID=A0A9Q0Y155_9SAUR|nr:hypothetical protein JRQ81_010820 [Phrynocephalus forsythii]
MALFPIIWIVGLVGNGIVIWFLSFVIRRNPITTYVLNLAVADFGVLACCIFLISFSLLEEETDLPSQSYVVFFLLFLFTHATSLHLLTAISAERCISMLFPIWYRCRRPKHQSATVCALIWATYLLLNAINIFVWTDGSMDEGRVHEVLLTTVFTINFFFCTPLMVLSSVTLFIRVCCGLHRRQHRTLSVALLLAIFFFIMFGVPFSALVTISRFYMKDPTRLFLLGLAFITINSSINPLIYFVVGRKNRCKCRENFTAALQTVFSDKADGKEDGNRLDFQMQ